jgi:hypothetical protein
MEVFENPMWNINVYVMNLINRININVYVMNLMNRINLNLFMLPLLYSLHNFYDFHSSGHGRLVLQFVRVHFLRRNLALTSPTSGGHSVGMTKATDFFYSFYV